MDTPTKIIIFAILATMLMALSVPAMLLDQIHEQIQPLLEMGAAVPQS